MCKFKKNILNIVLLGMFLTLIFSTSSTFAFWANQVQDGNDTISGQISLGTWDITPDGINPFVPSTTYTTGDIVWYNNMIWVYRNNNAATPEPSVANGWTTLNDYNWYPTIIYRDDEIVFYNDTIYRADYYNINENPSTSNAWINTNTNDVEWKTGQASTKNQVVYYQGQLYIHKSDWSTTEPGTGLWAVLGDFTWISTNTYWAGDLVLYNGIYYSANYYTVGNTPGSHGSWSVATIPNWSASIPNGTKFVWHNGNIYKPLVNLNGNNKKNEPGTAAGKGIWQMLGTQQWQQYNTYALNDLVMHNGYVYQLTNVTNSIIEPGTAANSWNLKNTIDYQPFNYYANGDYAIYNGEVYVVVNQTNANYNVAPGSVANAWNNISGFYWLWYNVYQVDSIVIYNNTVYKAIAITTNHEPGTPAGAAYWQINNV